MEDLKIKKRVRADSVDLDPDMNWPEVKRPREDLLDGFDDESYFCTANLDLDSFIKSFQDEIGTSPPPPAILNVVDLTSDSGDSQPDLGYLLGASDDELGLPPPTTSSGKVESDCKTELIRVVSDSSELSSDFWVFDGEIPGYNSFEFGMVETVYHDDNNSEYVALDGLFYYSDMDFGSNDFGLRPESTAQ